MQLNVKAFLVLAAAVFASGCEQIKSLKNVHELEGKVEELSKQVAELQGAKPGAGSGSAKPGAAKPEEKTEAKGAAKPEENTEAKADDKKSEDKPEAKKAEGDDKKAEGDDKTAKVEDKKADPKDGEDKKGEDKKGDDKKTEDKKTEDKKSEDKKDDTVAAAGPADASGKAATADAAPPPDAGLDDPAFKNLLHVVAENTGRTRPNGPVGDQRWDYSGKNGSAAWASIDPSWKACGAGKAQSPIDIEPKSGSAKPIVFHYKPTIATVMDTGRTLQVNVAPGSTIEIGDAVYQLVQFQFHAPSEHTIAGEHYPLEVQLVHKDGEGKQAVISVLYDTGAEAKPLANVWSAWPHKLGAEAKLAKPFDPSALLPETRTVFRYTGSLTTPPCTEGVVWNVMRRTLSESKAHLDAFGARYTHNSRELQALNERTVE